MAQTRQIVRAGAWLISSVTLALPLQAQIYRCANSYSQVPCPGGIAIDLQDSRSPTQKAQSDAATVQAVRLANEMEKERLKGELIAGKKVAVPVANTKSKPTTASPTTQGRGRKDSQPGPFVAFTPPQKKPGTKKTEGATTKP